LKNPKKILIIIQRSNGDVFLSLSLIKWINDSFKSSKIDLLVNDDTAAVAKLLPFINKIHIFSYDEKKKNRFNQEKNLFNSLFRKYDLSINLTASDRSVIYALLASKNSISAVETDYKKSWWKKKLLTHYYSFDSSKHVLKNNLKSLKILNIQHDSIQQTIDFSEDDILAVKDKLDAYGVNRFIIFHPSAQYEYKVYPKNLRDKLLTLLNTLGIPIIITGGNNKIDQVIKKEVLPLTNVFNLIGKTSLKEYFIISKLSIGYIGMDTLNMHIAASQNKRIFAIFGPTNLSMWSPWSNDLETATSINQPVQTYGSNTLFQGSLPCVACGKAGCDDNHGKSECLNIIDPQAIFEHVSSWYNNV
jgi:heptosyltransferase III